MVRDQGGNVNQSFYFSIFLKRIPILLIISPLFKNSLFVIEFKSISFSDKLKILRAF